MSSLLKVADKLNSAENTSKGGHNNYNQTSILKSKENVFKHKCSKALKNKLKKYKLRRDGQEDPDILDVSRILVSSLNIKSPNSQPITKLNHVFTKQEDSKPKNYLFKMVRRKKTCLKSDLKVISGSKSVSLGSNDERLPMISEIETQDCKQMDAFKLLMDGRNKSIGRNSPGKDKVPLESEMQEIIKNKETKAKRILSLEKLAEEKGLSKNKEIEEFREECVKKKMVKRAERLKNMITTNNSKCDKKQSLKYANKPSVGCITIESNDSNAAQSKKCCIEQKGSLKLFDFLSDPETLINKGQVIQKLSKEDDEFLNKLSPSIRKKENMLSYFKKLTKDTELSEEEESCESIIKVKFTPKRKRKSKPSNILNDSLKVFDNGKCNTALSNSTQLGQKRKRELNNENNKIPFVEDVVQIVAENNNVRPKRNIKKPTKYSEDVNITSSDEEMHIFTPKKKRNLEKKGDAKLVKEEKESNYNNNKLKEKYCDKIETELEHKKKHSKKDSSVIKKDTAKSALIKKTDRNKATKLAPIFVTRSQPSPVELEAKQIFLKSGVPDKLKIKSQHNNISLSTNTFHTVVHVQQLLTNHSVVSEKNWFHCSEVELCQKYNNTSELYFFEKLLHLAHASDINTIYSKHKPDRILKSIKSAIPKFPVYRTYHLLKTKSQGELPDCNYSVLDSSIEIVNGMTDFNNENPEKLSWNDKYKPTSSNQIIGNFASVKELKRWLESWTEHLVQNKSNYNEESDLSDFCYSDNDDSKDMFRHKNNILIITGQAGSGKTSSVYAVAAELAIKVIEVNASTKRTGKIMLQDLQEATQSHKVNRSVNKIDNSQKMQEDLIPCKINKKRGRPKKTYERIKPNKIQTENYEKDTPKDSQQSNQNSQENSRTAMSLILIDDADIVFDQDDGFCSAVSQLIQSSKRPVILVTTSLSCPHLQKFISCGKIIYMNPLLPKMLGTWLDIMCLADTGLCYPGLGKKLLDYYNGDIRKTINFLQYFVTSEKYLRQVEDQSLSQITNTYKANIDDENSSMSWVGTDVVDNNFVKETLDTNETKQIIDQQFTTSQYDICKKIFDVWWSIKGIMDRDSIKECTDRHKKMPGRVVQILNSISLIDTAIINNNNVELDIFSRPWHCTAVASVIETDNFDYYNKSDEVTRHISSELLIRSLYIPRHIKLETYLDLHPPSMSLQRQRNKLVSRHNTLTSHLNPSAALDRRALALDYWPFCRTICRIEKNKTDSNIKRNNRFCHYLKSVNILCKNEYFDSLSESLC